eukprot:TRINITY_DN1747_c0_g1_i2.p1 TRINITY_DN1747_c0_g1~~TRINITY_DN1747_c0_g1_i2.p1  ORF type:complete len:412 (+),score=57.60 TRINITY_DN1747_c0_g1_i2:61-1296(+)
MMNLRYIPFNDGGVAIGVGSGVNTRFAALPDEIISLILCRLPGENIFRSAQVCKRWLFIVNHEAFWEDLCKEENLWPAHNDTDHSPVLNWIRRIPSQGSFHAQQKRPDFRLMYTQHVQQQRREQSRRRKFTQNVLYAAKAKKISLSLWASVVSLLVSFAVLLPLKLDGFITTTWTVLMTPLWIACAFTMFAVIAGLLASRKASEIARDVNPRYRCAGVDLDWIGVALMSVFVSMVLLVTLYFALVAARADNLITLSWKLVFTPLWIVIVPPALLLLLVVIPLVINATTWFARAASICGLLSCWAFVLNSVVMALKLEGDITAPWYQCNTAVWIVMTLWMMLPAVSLLDPASPLSCFMVPISMAVALVVATVVMTTLVADHVLTILYTTAFSPLWTVFALCVALIPVVTVQC